MTSPAPQPLPAFDVVLRGFHRHQVDGLIDRVNFTLATLTGAPVFTDAAIPIAGLPPEQNPDPITAQELRAATLDLVLRGYDRSQVSYVLSDLAERLDDAESRTARG
ncbi:MULTISPECIES: hypothetical protein [Nocardiopsis]|jgi:DivIVA domain-containing protein|uniref:DivIVA domain-containing protein n=1 Tax=Nocardiopsis sinuspersici TaxID=501010 RepID=A0A1V3C552_9ACTN|nr:MULTISPECIES: hypothetical protein [Nocardiopsis]NYH52329.1 DivIVA domain-containing protein [Nocardiopsis sinuspersici]OOC55823.1 hypothetical protein NOSIN_19960 [Nocardiopsis sinuspersici]